MSGNQLFGAVTLNQTIFLLQHDLFPFADVLHVDVSGYISIILNHTRVTDEDKQFIRNGVQWLNEESVTQYRKIYITLQLKERQNILNTISKERWGESFIDEILTYTMEAVFSDPIYGVNIKRAGQKWLGFENGLPYPKEALL